MADVLEFRRLDRDQRSAREPTVFLALSESDLLRMFELVQRQMVGQEVNDRMELMTLLLVALTGVSDGTVDLLMEQQQALLAEFGPMRERS